MARPGSPLRHGLTQYTPGRHKSVLHTSKKPHQNLPSLQQHQETAQSRLTGCPLYLFAPFSTRSLTIDSHPIHAARISGLSPSEVMTSVQAPLANSIRVICSWPFEAAQWRGYQEPLLGVFTFAPFSISSRERGSLFFITANMSGVDESELLGSTSACFSSRNRAKSVQLFWAA